MESLTQKVRQAREFEVAFRFKTKSVTRLIPDLVNEWRRLLDYPDRLAALEFDTYADRETALLLLEEFDELMDAILSDAQDVHELLLGELVGRLQRDVAYGPVCKDCEDHCDEDAMYCDACERDHHLASSA